MVMIVTESARAVLGRMDMVGNGYRNRNLGVVRLAKVPVSLLLYGTDWAILNGTEL